MSTARTLDRWRDAGAINSEQHAALAALVRKERVSVFVELNVLLYAGVVAIVAGVGWTVATYSARLGDAAILFLLSAVFAWSLWYCFGRGLPYSNQLVEHPHLAFDYVLYLGCLVFGIELAYLQTRFGIFPGWDHSLLLAASVYALLAYWFDNRLVLSLALSSLGGWFGVRMSRLGFLLDVSTLRLYALAYSTLVAAAGSELRRARVKAHFLSTYLHVAANVAFAALVSGAALNDGWLVYFSALLVLSGASIAGGVRFGYFAFVVYGVLYGYAGITVRALHDTNSFTSAMSYFVVSGVLVVALLVVLARRFGRET